MDLLSKFVGDRARTTLVGLTGLTFIILAPVAWAAGSVDTGQSKSVTCAACHGADGNSQNPEWPSLAGQNARYLVESLQSFKSGSRENVLMAGQVMALSDQDIEDLAAYYAAQDIARKTADKALVEVGERLYRGGNRDRSISACIACHGPTGRGNPAAGYPSLSGQHATYTATQLRAYKARTRKSDGGRQIMRSIAAGLTEDEIVAVASYIQGLR